MSGEDRLVALVADLARRLGGEASVQELLDLVVERATAVLSVSGVGLVLAATATDRAVTVASDPALARHLAHQVRQGAGPSLSAHHACMHVGIPDLAAEPRFPGLLQHARAAGFSALDALPLRAAQGSLGALEVARLQPGHLESRALADTVLLAEVVAAHVTSLRARQRYRDLAADVGHELRTPLTSIAGFLEILGEEASTWSPGQRDALAAIERNTGRLTALTEDLVTARGPEHRDHSGYVEVDLAEVVRGVAVVLRPVGTDHHVRAEFTVPDHRVPVLGDEQDLQSLVANLVGNALKFTASGGEVHCRLTVAGARAHLQVDDDGPGIPPHHLPHLFTRHYRASTDRRDMVEGSGLGLAIAAVVVRHHGGEISVRSQLGEGSVFTVDLPLLAAVELREGGTKGSGSFRPSGPSGPSGPTPGRPPRDGAGAAPAR